MPAKAVHIQYTKQVIRMRRRKDGKAWRKEYWYYRRAGAPADGQRLPGDGPTDPAFMTALRQFNARAEYVPPETVAGTFANLVRRYLGSPEFADVSKRTQGDYRGHLGKLQAIFGEFPVSEIDREAVYALRDRFASTPYLANYYLRVFRRLLNWALDRGEITENPAARPRQLKTQPRQAVWSLEAEAAFLRIAGPNMRIAYLLQAYSAQRQGDVLSMTWAQYSDGILRLRQHKTGTLIEVPAHSVLRAALDARRAELDQMGIVALTILTAPNGKPWGADAFRHEWRRITLEAGLDGLQNRDLRRTAMVRLAEAGANDIEIAAVSGHAIEATRRILEVYIPRTGKMAAKAIRHLERAGTRSKAKS